MKRASGFLFLLAVIVLAASATSWADPPEQSGPFVFRGETTFGVSYVDGDSRLIVALGWDFAAWCAGLPDVSDDAQYMIRFDPQMDQDPIMHMSMEDAQARLWNYTPGTPVCAQVLAAGEPLATGTVQLRYFNRDYWFDADTEPSNIYGFTAQGVMTTAAGERIQFNTHNKCHHNPGYSVTWCNSHVTY